jgi:hypothetical protein
MQGTHNIHDSLMADDGDRLDPGDAARLLTDAQRDARNRFALRPPRVTATMGPLILGAYVALWLSTRGQHPYQGPSLGVVGLVYLVVAIVYGVIPAAVPLIVIGTTLVGIAVSKEDWPQFGAALVVIVAGIVAAYVGPSGAWLAAGIGLFVAVEGYALATGYAPIHAQ